FVAAKPVTQSNLILFSLHLNSWAGDPLFSTLEIIVIRLLVLLFVFLLCSPAPHLLAKIANILSFAHPTPT
ncbi:hypothetical protein, partial [Altererythrobacter sp.]|uniref:hypothetical protein n=1 Tax=Altererythrobacter sp. TaxID=1872480 RepID=UPI003D045E20